MSGISEFMDDAKSRRMGFSMREVMTGHHEFEPGFGPPGKRPMEFRVNWGTDNVLRWTDPDHERFLVNDMEGVIDIAGLCESAPCAGSLELRYFKDASLRYILDFAVDGQDYHYVGDKLHLRPWNLYWTHTTCFGRLTKADTKELVSTSLTHFRWRTVPAFVASFRLRM